MASVTFFLGRVHKLGRVTHQVIKEAIEAPIDIVEREYKYSFVDAHVDTDGNNIRYIYAKLVNFSAIGPVVVVDPENHTTMEAPMKNKMDAEVAFVYVPEFEGIAFHRVWNRLTPEQFVARFDKLVAEKLGGIMAQVEIEPIANLEQFAKQIKSFKSFKDIRATVTPPNPLFGPAWESLKAHLEGRNLKTLQIQEEAKEGASIASGLSRLLELLAAKVSPSEIKKLISASSIADQAVLMSADGYGSARVRGVDHENHIRTYNTRDDQLSFEFPQMPSKEELYERTRAELLRINDDRYLGH